MAANEGPRAGEGFLRPVDSVIEFLSRDEFDRAERPRRDLVRGLVRDLVRDLEPSECPLKSESESVCGTVFSESTYDD